MADPRRTPTWNRASSVHAWTGSTASDQQETGCDGPPTRTRRISMLLLLPLFAVAMRGYCGDDWLAYLDTSVQTVHEGQQSCHPPAEGLREVGQRLGHDRQECRFDSTHLRERDEARQRDRRDDRLKKGLREAGDHGRLRGLSFRRQSTRCIIAGVLSSSLLSSLLAEMYFESRAFL